MQIKKQLIMLGLSALLAQGVLPASLSAQQTKTEKVPGISLSDMDRKVRPQDNFYRYSNGGWIRKNPLKPAYSRFGTFDILRDTATSQIRHIVEELIAKPQTKGTNDYRVAVLYKQSLDSAERNRQGYKPSRESKPRKTYSSISLSRTKSMVKVASSARASQLTRRIVP